MTYLLDANTLIEAKNRYYQMHICPGYWDWLIKANRAGEVNSIRSVMNCNAATTHWLNGPKTMPICSWTSLTTLRRPLLPK